MAKTYDELREMGWWIPSDNPIVASRPEIFKNYFRESGEADAEFRERLERATPEYVISPASLPERLAEAKRVWLEAEEALERAKEHLAFVQRQMNEQYRWRVYTDDYPEMSWDELQNWRPKHYRKGDIVLTVTSPGRAEFSERYHQKAKLCIARRIDAEGNEI